jgi:uncharacterized membrane protein
LNFNSRQVAHVSTFTAIGAVSRIALDQLALASPTPVYGVLIAVGLTETLTFVDGFVYGPLTGFVTGALIIVVSDLATLPGPWTPFIAAIIGLLGVLAGIMARPPREPTFRLMAASAVVLTLLSESLQNAWVSLFYSTPFIGVMIVGLPTLIAAVINNLVMFTAVAPRIIRFLRRHEMKR